MSGLPKISPTRSAAPVLTRCGLALLLALTPAVALADEDEAPPAGPAVVRVGLVRPVSRVLPTLVTGYGAVSPDSDALVSLSYPRAGQVSRLLVRPGQPVAKGTPLVAFTTDPATLAANAKARSALVFAQGEVARTEALLAQHLATNSQMAAARQALSDAQATLAAERALGTGTGETVLTAPFDGYVDSLLVTLGDRIQPGAAIARLGRGAGVRVVAGVEPARAALVHPGQTVAVTPLEGPLSGLGGDPAAGEGDGAVALTGHVVAVAGMVNPATRWVDVTVVLDGVPDGAVRPLPGTPVRAVVTADQHTGLVVPRAAVLADGDGSYLFQVRDGHAARVAVAARPVESVSPAADPLMEVSGSLAAGLPVVVVGNYELEDGQAVAPIPAPAPAPAPIPTPAPVPAGVPVKGQQR